MASNRFLRDRATAANGEQNGEPPSDAYSTNLAEGSAGNWAYSGVQAFTPSEQPANDTFQHATPPSNSVSLVAPSNSAE
jgi:hypothetical protein